LIEHASANVAFNNLTAGTTQNRQFDLYVGNGGFETGDLTDWTLVGSTIGATNQVFALADDDLAVAGQDALPGQPDELFVHSGIWGAYLGFTNNATLSQTVPTTAGQPLLVSFWFTSVPDDTDDPPTNNFIATWNSATLFSQTNVTVSVWTNMQYIVSSSTRIGKLQFEFNNSPGAFGLDDVTVQTVPAPTLNSTVISGGNIAFNWGAIPSVSYQIQSTTNLGNSSWTDLGGPIPATNTVLNISLPIGNGPDRFYRVVMTLP
jgi:hypothetical protein